MVLVLCSHILQASALAEPPLIFSDQDLERYQRPEDTRRQSAEPDAAAQGHGEKVSVKDDQHKPNRYEVPYTPYEGTSRRVIIPVRLNNKVTAKMALDTGSPGMVIFDRLAGRLGILEKDDGNLITFAAGIGGTTPAIFTIIDTVQVDKAEDSFIPTVVTESLTNAFDGLIGMDFMANYSLRIDTTRRIVVFEENMDTPNRPAGHDEIWWRSNFRNFASMRNAWKQYREALIKLKTDPKKVEELKKFADRQYREADKLFTRLNNYAINHSVPMQWREY